MPKRRLVVSGTGLRPVQREPAVRVRDTFIPGATARGASSDLEQLARGLGNLAPKLQGFALQLQEKRRTEGQVEGRTRLVELAQEQEDLGEAVKLGLIEFKDNPFARAGLLEQAGRIDGDRYGDELRLAVAQLSDAEKTDIAAYDRAASAVFARHQEVAGRPGESNIYRGAFAITSQAHTANQRVAFAAQQSAALVGVAGEQLFAETFGKIETSIQEGISQEDLGAVLSEIGRNAVLNGMNGTLVNATIVKAVAQAAIEMATTNPTEALATLDILDHVQGGSGPLSRTLAGTEAINTAIDTVSRTIQRNTRYQEWQDTQAATQLRDDTYGAAIGEMLAADDPTEVDLAPYIAKMSGDPRAAGALLGIQNAISGGEFNTVETVYTSLATRIWTDGDVTPTEVMNAVGARQLAMPDANNLLSMISTKQRAARAGQQGTDPIFTNALTDISRSFQDSLGVLGGLRGEQASRAEASLQWDYYRARDAGVFADMDDAGKVAWLRGRANHWVEYYGGGKPIGGELQGHAVQAFVGQPDVWSATVVVSLPQLAGLTERMRTRTNTPADNALLRQLGVPPQMLMQFLTRQRELILETVSISNTAKPEDEAFSQSLTEG